MLGIADQLLVTLISLRKSPAVGIATPVPGSLMAVIPTTVAMGK
jgi:hypothetical protein